MLTIGPQGEINWSEYYLLMHFLTASQLLQRTLESGNGFVKDHFFGVFEVLMEPFITPKKILALNVTVFTLPLLEV